MKKQELIEVLEMILSSLKESKRTEDRQRETLEDGGSGGIPEEWAPSQEAIDLAHNRRISVSQCASKFRDWLGRSGKTFPDYDARFMEWLMYEKQPPEGESNADYAPQINYMPTEREFDLAAANFVKSNSLWGRGMGPEPGMLGCKCPSEILIRHGIDPKTGLVRKVA